MTQIIILDVDISRCLFETLKDLELHETYLVATSNM